MRKFGPSLLLFLLVSGAYLANGRTIGAGDTMPAAYLPWSLVRQQNFDFDEFPILYEGVAPLIFPILDGTPYYLQYRNGHYLSAYNLAAGVLALPVYALPIAMGAGPDPTSVARLEKLSAAIITALSVVFLYWALGNVTSPGWALAIALVYAFGTSSLSMSSQGLWQHGPSQMFLALGLCLLAKGLRDERYLGHAGLPLAAAVVMRTTDLLLIGPLCAWLIYAHPRRARSLVLWALPPAVAGLAYYAVYLAPADRGLGHTTAPFWAFFSQMPLGESLPGVLLSPSRGLFVYSPVLLFSLAGIVMVWRDGPAAWRALSLGLPLGILLICKWIMWWGGHSWGPRLLADLDPILCFFLYPLTTVLDRRRLLKAVFVILALWSVGAHALGAWLYDRRWDVITPPEFHARLSAWRESPLAFYAREALFRLTSRRAEARPSGSLAATYTIGPAPSEVMSGERFALSVSAVNAGGEVWRSSAPEDRGVVRLGWRWYRGEQEVAAGRETPLLDVRPGGFVDFKANVIAPAAPGDYTLVVALAYDPFGWFGDHGDKPVRLSIKVSPLDFSRLLAEPIRPVTPAPRARIGTDRPSYRRDESQDLRIAVRYPHYPRSFDLYFILEPPDGSPLLFDGKTLPRRPEPPWLPSGRGLPLPARMDGRFTLPLSALPPGPYRWHVLLTDIGSYRPLTRATTTFTITE